MKTPFTPRGPALLPADLLAQVGQAVAHAATVAQNEWPDAPAKAGAALADLEQLGLRLQEVVRVLAAPARAELERVDLGLAVLQARAEWAATLHRAGVDWVGPDSSAEVMANPAVLKQLLDLALGHLLGLGQRLSAELRVFGQPLQAKLCLTASTPGGEPFSAPPGDADEWHWVLFAALALQSGVLAERQVQSLGVELAVTWPAVSPLRRLAR